ncbi:DUF6210 family protein [Kitasatospora sp. NPDC101447]|uniref:DUF6210 family protein n=1 Tax=Kitasatospora sp. NPDC101447 TaxID=3364102 RepID=UPI0038306BC8
MITEETRARASITADRAASGTGFAALVGAVRYWACDGTTVKPHRLQLDESRIREADEAWVPVITPDGPGVLVWLNSD